MNRIKIEATIAAPISKVWAMWTEPNHITKWNFASDDWQCPSAANELKVGGKYSARMEAKDGSFGFDFNATYIDVADKQKLSYKMEDGREVTTVFESAGDKTRVMTEFDAESQNSAEMQRAGWQSILNNFKKYAEGA